MADPPSSVKNTPRNPTGQRFATIIPLHTSRLRQIELRRVIITLENVPSESVFLVGPVGLDRHLRGTMLADVPFLSFPELHFASIQSYNEWMLLPDLYSTFASFEFILLCQTDAIVTRPLPPDVVWDFDYLGAPWAPPVVVHWSPLRRRLVGGGNRLVARQLHVGNGGLSLRRTSIFSSLKGLPRFSKTPNEDIAISYFYERLGVRIASRDTASRYFMETEASYWRPSEPIPDAHGFHALDRFNPALEQEILEQHQPLR